VAVFCDSRSNPRLVAGGAKILLAHLDTASLFWFIRNMSNWRDHASVRARRAGARQGGRCRRCSTSSKVTHFSLAELAEHAERRPCHSRRHWRDERSPCRHAREAGREGGLSACSARNSSACRWPLAALGWPQTPNAEPRTPHPGLRGSVPAGWVCPRHEPGSRTTHQRLGSDLHARAKGSVPGHVSPSPIRPLAAGRLPHSAGRKRRTPNQEPHNPACVGLSPAGLR